MIHPCRLLARVAWLLRNRKPKGLAVRDASAGGAPCFVQAGSREDSRRAAVLDLARSALG